ncbi:MAG: hypothetical protein KGJ80_12500, partial [Chloroflexota bacterium]|nr:hypothetical protein [Chloroflexota bacterium]
NIEQSIHAVLPFRDHSRLHAEIQLAADGEPFEERYAYVYYDTGGQRILQYDNRDHHPEISTYPHHMHKGAIPSAGEKDRAWLTDLEFVNLVLSEVEGFETVLQRIRERFFSE